MRSPTSLRSGGLGPRARRPSPMRDPIRDAGLRRVFGDEARRETVGGVADSPCGDVLEERLNADDAHEAPDGARDVVRGVRAMRGLRFPALAAPNPRDAADTPFGLPALNSPRSNPYD